MYSWGHFGEMVEQLHFLLRVVRLLLNRPLWLWLYYANIEALSFRVSVFNSASSRLSYDNIKKGS